MKFQTRQSSKFQETETPLKIFKTTYTRKEFWLLNFYSILAIMGVVYITEILSLIAFLFPAYILFFLWLCVGRIRYLGFSTIFAVLFLLILLSTFAYLLIYGELLKLSREYVHIQELSQNVADMSLNGVGAILVFIVTSFLYAMAFYIKIEVSAFDGKVYDLREIKPERFNYNKEFMIDHDRFIYQSETNSEYVADGDKVNLVAWCNYKGEWVLGAIWNRTKEIKEILSTYLSHSILSFLLFFSGLAWIVKVTPQKLGIYAAVFSILFVNGIYSYIKHKMLTACFNRLSLN